MDHFYSEGEYEIVDTRLIYLTSAARADLTNPIYDAKYIVEPYIFSVKEDEYIELQMSTFVCKYSFYNIDTDRNASVDISINGGGSFSTQTLPTGNYSTKEIAANIQTLIRTVTSDNMTVTWNKNKNKYKYTADVVNLNNVILKYPANETGYEIYGFSKNRTTLNGDGTRQVNLGAGLDADSLCPDIVSIGNEESLYINCDFSPNKNYNLKADGKQRENNVYAKVHIISPFYGFIYYVASEYNLFSNHYPVGVSPPNEFDIRITDEFGNFIKLQNEYQCTFRVIKRRKVVPRADLLLSNLLKLNAAKLVQDRDNLSKLGEILK